MMQIDTKKLTFAGALVALGIVFGDIGTSPLYVMSAIMSGAGKIDRELILGALSCIIWTLTLQTTVKYVIITLRADNKGEGGIFAIFTLVRKNYPKVYILAIIGSCALLADGVITPSITVTSAIEGLTMISPHIRVVPIVVLILSGLFLVQRFGTVKIGQAFGPVMTLWFAMLGVLGIMSLSHDFSVLESLNPYYAINLLHKYPGGFILLGAVFLATTGAEALYSDLGHCGIKNIRISWIYVKLALVINYMGQGAWILSHTKEAAAGANPFFSMMPSWFLSIGIIMSTLAAVIASQALITGSYTLISEAVRLNLWPRVKLIYPTLERGQIYIPFVNNVLWVACLFIVFHFKTSMAMQAAYGLSITIAMLMTTTMLLFYFRQRKVALPWIILFGACYYTIEGSFFVANINKFFEGAWITVAMMLIFAAIMYSYRNGQLIKRRYVTLKDIEPVRPMFRDLSADTSLPLTAANVVYMTQSRDISKVESKTLYSIFNKQPKRAQRYWFLHVDTLDEPYTLEYKTQTSDNGLICHVSLRLGFKVGAHVSDYLGQIIADMAKKSDISLVSPYPSIAKYGIPANFIFVTIERIVYNYDNFTIFERGVLKMYNLVKYIGRSDVAAYEIDDSIVINEKVPLVRGTPKNYPNLKKVDL